MAAVGGNLSEYVWFLWEGMSETDQQAELASVDTFSSSGTKRMSLVGVG